MTARMHPLFAELFLDPDGGQEDDETRRARAKARRARRRQAMRPTVRPRPAPRRG